MKYSYYPGCSLKGTAEEFDHSLRAVCSNLGIDLQELEDWNCCGASSAHGADDYLAIALPARTLAQAERTGLELVVPCAACFNRLKWAQYNIRKGGAAELGISPPGDVTIRYVLDIFTNPTISETIKSRIRSPLKGLKAVSYYGCLGVRPPEVTETEDFENPCQMDEILETLGAESLGWSYKTLCCGGSLAITRSDIVTTLAGKIISGAREVGADCIVVGCPLCHANLDTRQDEIESILPGTPAMPIFYVTELIGLALGVAETSRFWGKHLADPRPILGARNLLSL